MRSSAENYIARDKSLELDPTKQVKTVRQLEKSLPVDETPFFEASDDVNSEEFVNANDPENKFVPIEEVADPDSDFLEKEEEESEVELGEPEVNEELPEGGLEEVRRSISDYSFKRRGSKFSNLESFHVDHDKGEMLAVGTTEDKPDHEDVKEKDEDEFELAEADSSEAKYGRMPGRLDDTNKYGGDQKRIDNLKTWNDNKRQRAERGLIRRFLDRLN